MVDFSKKFTIKTIVGHISFDVLENYLIDQGATIPENIKSIFESGTPKKSIQNISDWIERVLISKERRNKILDDMRTIYLMTRPGAMGNFISTYKAQIPDLAKTAVQNYTSEYDRAVQFILFCPSVCKEWAHIYAIEGLPRRAWVEHNTYVPADLTELTDDQAETITAAIKEILQDQILPDALSHQIIRHEKRLYLFIEAPDHPKTERYYRDTEWKSDVFIFSQKISIRIDLDTRKVSVHSQTPALSETIHDRIARTVFETEKPETKKGYYNIPKMVESLMRDGRFQVRIPTGSIVQDIWIYSAHFIHSPTGALTSIHAAADDRANTGQDLFLAAFSGITRWDPETYLEKGMNILIPTSLKFRAIVQEAGSQPTPIEFSIWNKGKQNNLGISAAADAIQAVLSENGFTLPPPPQKTKTSRKTRNPE